MVTKLEEELLRKLIQAENDGQPLTHAQLGNWTRGSTFEDLWAVMSIIVVGQEHNLVCQVNRDSQYIASPAGKWKIAKLDAERAGQPVPPFPPREPV